MFDYVEKRPFALTPDDLSEATGPVLAAMGGGAPLALTPRRFSGAGQPLDWVVTPEYRVGIGEPSAQGTIVEIRVTPKVNPMAWLLFAALVMSFFPAAIGLMFYARERFRAKARLTVSSMFASLGTTSGLVAAGYAAVPPR